MSDNDEIKFERRKAQEPILKLDNASVSDPHLLVKKGFLDELHESLNGCDKLVAPRAEIGAGDGKIKIDVEDEKLRFTRGDSDV